MRTLTLSLVAVSVLFGTACTPSGVGRSQPGEGAIATDGQAARPTAQGTVSGGGGNGCEGKAFEAYAEKIANFDEYRLYIKPILRRMSEEGNDPLVSYLNWVADEKVWYFVPCQLEKLSQEQIGLAIDSDQLARHGEHGIYIFGDKNDTLNAAGEVNPESKSPLKGHKHYFNQRLKPRAALLLHEMVMGARLLMKKSAKEQCERLSKTDSGLCSDPDVLAIAETVVVDPKQSMIMNADDHEAVRAMTAYLAEKGAELSAGKVAAARQRLGFGFPWDRAASKLDFQEFIRAFARSAAADDRYFVKNGVSPYFKDLEAACSLAVSQSQYDGLSISMNFVSNITDLSATSTEAFNKKFEIPHYSTVCAANRGSITPPQSGNSGGACQTHALAWPGMNAWLHINSNNFNARGVLLDGQLVDEVEHLAPNGEYMFKIGKLVPDFIKLKVFITRDVSPRLLGLKIEFKHRLRQDFTPPALDASSGRRTDRDSRATKLELVDYPSLPPIECGRPKQPETTR
ncbi:MAG: hypothetical protein U1E10_12530 [Bdellovibrionales bacterium]|nr:hypothetical protein [Bdellovibrionales bacterium]